MKQKIIKMFQFTLFKKIFFIIFIGFLIVEGINVYLDYQSYVLSTAYNMISEKSKTDIANLSEKIYNTEKTFSDEELIKMYQNINRDYGYYAIYNEKNLIYEELLDYNLGKTLYLITIVENDMTSGVKTAIDISKLTQQQINQIDQIVKLAYQKNNKIEVHVSGDCKDIKSMDNNEYRVINPQYLNINNNLILNLQKNDDAQRYIVETYCSSKIKYTSYSSNGKSMLKDYDEIKKQCQMSVSGSIETGSLGLNTLYYKIVGNNLYAIMMTNAIDGDGHEYIFVQVQYSLNIVHELLESAIAAKRFPYSMALVITVCMSLFISYMITRPIKKVQKAALKIANQEFGEPLKVKSKDEIGSLANSINIMREQLNETIKKLHEEINHVKELENLRKDFINQFTHEMKTPLGIINGYSELIEEAENEEEAKKYLDIINRETSRINQLIQSMLSLSRLEAGKVELQKEILDLEDLVTEIVDEYEILYMQKNIKIEILTEDKELYADKKLISTVIHNFLSNAIKHTLENGKIFITICQGVSIYNEGEIIPEDNIESIWYTFVTHDHEGSGLGLAICRSILELHQFEYGVKNKENGVEFYFMSK